MKGQSKPSLLFCSTFLCSGGNEVQKHSPICNSHTFTWLHECRQRTVMLRTWTVHWALHTCVAVWNSWLLPCCAPLCPLLPLALSLCTCSQGFPSPRLTPCRWPMFHTMKVKSSPGLWGRFSTECSHILSRPEIGKIPPCGKIIFSCCIGSHILSWMKKEEEGRKQKAGAENSHWCGCCFGNALL